ncbi:metallophosphoesterase family protein [Chloroflexota bacterium]
MRYAIISDIHANMTAFTSVLNDIERRGGTEEIWCLGDVVGYGPDPQQCLNLLRQYTNVCVAGNHDWAATGKLDTSEFNPDATNACHWTTRQLSSADKEYLVNLPLVISKNDFTLVHGSPRDPLREYLVTTSQAENNSAYYQTLFCLVGNSHIPLVFRYDKTGGYSLSQLSTSKGIILAKSRLIINPGSIGQPRDGDPRASYAIYDSETRLVRLHRVPYEIEFTQKKMIKYGLPTSLAARLSFGR